MVRKYRPAGEQKGERLVNAISLTLAQRRIWFAEQFRDVGATYVLDASLHLAGPLDVAALEAALVHLAERHPTLRLRVAAGDDGVPRQWIASDPVTLRCLRAHGSTPDERRADAAALLRAEISRPMDLARGPIFAPVLIEVASAEHLLALPYHHLAGDGESHRTLRTDLLALYESKRTGMAPDLPLSAAPYEESVRDEASEQARAARNAALAAARERLAGAPAESTVPTDRPRPVRTRPAAHCVRDDLGPELATALAAFARARRVTPFIVCSAALHLMLQRYSGQEETLTGFMTAGRNAGQKGNVGFYAQTVVQRLAAEPGDTVGALLRRLRTDILAADEQRHASLEDLVEALGRTGATGRHPLFQAMINMVDPGPDIVRGRLSATPLTEPVPLAWLDLEFRLYPRPDGTIESWLRAPADLYDRDTVTRLARHFRALVAALVAAGPDTPVAGLAMLETGERTAVLAAGEGTARPVGGTFAGRLRAALQRHPERTAVSFEGRALTYGELAVRVHALAGRLAAAGIGPGGLVAVSLPRGLDLVVALAGVTVAGAAYVPIEPDEPAARREFMLGDLQPAALIASGSDADGVPLVEVLRPAGPRTPADPQPDDLAYVIYTSGSTGTPKAAGNTQLALVNRIGWMQDDHRLGAGDAVVQKTPFTFDVSVWEFYWPLLTGARLVVARPGGHRDPGYLARLIRAENVTTIHFVPSMLRAFLAAGELSADLPLRRVLCSGEALSPQLATAFLDAHPAELHNLYGPTEAAIDVTRHRCTRDDGPVMPIGRAVPNTRVLVLDRAGEPVPFGGVGELHLGGVQLARGYLNRPDLTRQRFVPDPHRPGERLYRTGDLGRMRPDGTIEYLGRTDRQVKLRGLRIEPGEIEAVVEAVVGVGQAVVDVLGTDGAGALVAFGVSTGTGLTREGLVAALATRLPTHLLPARVHLLPRLPLSRNGKVDHRALAALDEARAGSAADDDRPATAAERRIAGLYDAVLGRTGTGVTDSFFAVGGDSIRSIELVARARAEGVALSVEQIFSHPSPRQLSAVAGTAAGAPAAAAVAPFDLLDAATRAALPAGVTDAFPLSPTLAGLLVESSRPDRYRVYTTSLRLRGTLDVAALEGALRVVLRRHPFLRSAVAPAPDGGEPCQVVYADAPAAVAVEDLRHLPATGRDRAVAAWLDAEATRGFDWARPPLLRLSAHRLTDDEFQLTLAEPYLDGYSAALVLTELLTAYQQPGAAAGDEVRGYTDYLAEQRRATERSAGFWRDQLAGTPDCHVHGLDADVDDATLSHVDVEFPADVPAALAALNRATGVPLKSILLAAHVRAVAAATAREDVVTGLMANARPETPAGAAIVGLFLNAVPLRVGVAAGTWWDLVENVQRAEAATLPHRQYPFAQLRRDRLVDGVGTLFNFTHFHPYDRIAAAGPLRVVDRVANDQTYFPLTAQFQLDPLHGTLALRLEFFGADITAAGRAAVAALFRTAVTEVARSPHARHDRTALGGSPSVLAGAPAAAFEALHRTFAATAARHPGRTAVRGGWTVAELDERSARVAVAVRDAGVRPGEPVGVRRERDPWLVASLLGILRAGGVALPLDPALPAERRATMVTAAGCRVVVGETFAPEDLPAGTGQSPDHDAGPEHPAYLIFTSGSTGAPKGVLVPHRAVANRLAWGRGHTPFTADDVVAARTPIAFVDSVAELLAGPLAGATTDLVPDTVQDPAALAEHLAAAAVTRVTTVPTLLAAMLNLERLPALPRLRHWTVSGETLPTDLARRLRRRLPEVRLLNLYGSTEVAADATAYVVRGDEAGAGAPIGQPIDGVTATVTDPWGNPVPRLIAGRLVIGGAAVGSGYLAGTPGGFADGTFATGDLARIGAAGQLEYLGRTDRQFKIRGVRLEPAEIESALCAVPAVTAAAVTATPRYAAFLVLAPGAVAPAPRVLRQHLRRRLPAAAIPDDFAVLERLPLTVTGKVDHRALAGLGRPLRAGSPGAAPATLVERELAVLWQDRLGRGPIRRDDDFFDAGGHSLQALLLIAAARQRMGVELTLADLFDHPTLVEQAELIEERLVAAASAPA
jgi:amino acid adenylation domain-containing protein